MLGREGLKFKFRQLEPRDHICQFVAIHAPITVLHMHAQPIRPGLKQIATNKTAAQLHHWLKN